MPITIGGLGLGALGTGVNLFNSYAARKRAQQQLDQLRNTPIPQYSATPELRSFYSQSLNDVNNPQGISGGERAAFRNDVNNTLNTQYRNAVNTSGGNMSRFIRNALNPSLVNASNRLAAMDLSTRRANRQSGLARQQTGAMAYQNINDRNIAAQQMRQQLIAQALGGSVAQQNANIAGAYNNFANLGFTTAGYGLSRPRGRTPLNVSFAPPTEYSDEYLLNQP
jgi:hypothetical protein